MEMKLALIQCAGADIDRYKEIQRHLLSLVRQACEQGAQLILLPECAYPAYFIGMDPERKWQEDVGALLEETAGLAKAHGVYIAMGLALPVGQTLHNSVVVFDSLGEWIGQTHKSNLWHFDYKWFTPGRESFVFDTPFGRIGVMVCADGRIPEIARMLRLRGAQLILDAVNLVASAERPQDLSNQQYRFMLQTRARENGVTIAVCDKVGVESGAVTFLGRSFVVGPDGEMPVQCSPDREEILYHELELPQPPPLKRKPRLYGRLAEPTEALAATRILEGAYRLRELELYTAVAKFAAADAAGYLAEARRRIQTAERMDARLLALPLAPEGMTEAEARSLAGDMAGDMLLALALHTEAGRVCLLLNRAGVLHSIHETHGDRDYPIETVEILPHIRVAALFGDEMLIPEIARVAMLDGADLLLWFDDEPDPFATKLLQTRAAENKLFALRSTSCEENDCGAVANPEGAILCTTYRTGAHMTGGLLHTAQSKEKEVVPGTNIVYGRIPEFYKELTIE